LSASAWTANFSPSPLICTVFAAAPVGLHRLGVGLQHHGGKQILGIDIFLQVFFQRVVAGIGRHVGDKTLGAAVAVAALVFQHALAQAGVSRFLVDLLDGV